MLFIGHLPPRNFRRSYSTHRKVQRIVSQPSQTEDILRNTDAEDCVISQLIHVGHNIAAHRSAAKTNEESISILSRSRNRSLVVPIAWKCNCSRWWPIGPISAKALNYVYLSS